MATERDLEFARLVLEKGWLDPGRLQECLETLRGNGRSLEEILREKGYVAEDRLALLASELSNPPPARDPGRTFGKFLLEKELGAGGMGVVYKAYQTDLRRTVALKFIRGVEGQEDLQRFLREAQTAGALHHPGIVTIFETGEIDGKHYIAMPFVDGLTFDRILTLREHFPVRRQVAILEEAARAVHYAHGQGIVHRDLKPQNIIVDQDGAGRVFVMDFGLAKSVKLGSSLTLSGMILGTPNYMPPEQAAGKTSEIDARSDVYALGSILYEIGAGRPPFPGDSPMDVVMKVIQDDAPLPRKINPKFHPDLETIAVKALEKPKSRRYASAEEFADELRRWLDGEPILARPASTLARWFLKLRKNKAVAAAVAVAVLGVITGGAFGVSALVQKSRIERRQREAAERRERARPACQEALYHYERADRARFIRDADISKQLDDLAEAERHLRNSLAEDPEFTDAWVLLGRVLAFLERNGEAIEAFTRAIEREPGNVTALVGRGTALNDIARRKSGAQGFQVVTDDVKSEADSYVNYFEDPHPDLEALRRRVDDDFRAAARVADKPYWRAYVLGMAELCSWNATETGRLDRAIDFLTQAAKLDRNLPEPFRNRAMAWHMKGDPDRALADIVEAERIAPNEPLTLYNLCVLLLLGGRGSEALPYADRAVRLRPNVAAHWSLRGMLLARAGRLEDSVADFRVASELKTCESSVWLNWAVAYWRADRFDLAWETFSRGLDRHPDSDILRTGRAAYLIERGRLEEAIPDLREALRIRPADTLHHLNLGVIFSRLGRFDEAEACYRRVLEIQPGHPRARIYLATLEHRRGRSGEALRRLLEIEKQGIGDRDLAYNLALVLLALGRFDEALGYAERAEKLMPDHAPLLAVFAELLNKLGRHGEALAKAERALRRDPKNWDAAFQRANALFAMQRLEEAESAYRSLLESGESWNARYNYATVLAQLGRMAEALAEFDRAVSLNPKSPSVRLNRGLARMVSGDLDGAGEDFDEALRLEPDRPVTLRARAQLRMHQERYEKALEDLDAYVKAVANDAQAWAMRAESLYWLARRDEALADFERAIGLDPKFGPAYAGRARIRADRKEFAKAVEDYRKAVEVWPQLAPMIRKELEEAERRARGE